MRWEAQKKASGWKIDINLNVKLCNCCAIKLNDDTEAHYLIKVNYVFSCNFSAKKREDGDDRVGREINNEGWRLEIKGSQLKVRGGRIDVWNYKQLNDKKKSGFSSKFAIQFLIRLKKCKFVKGVHKWRVLLNCRTTFYQTIPLKYL